ncbi:CPBP family intramembrane glutamic endopeptidase [Gaoshiqia sp. Z1-71]|uniref:CPBP family intramembrane glutamic endopeptidase n=1 Tax=Gaoshiqia hydrogeniformans TaxID=3290090 RepID=UPI003BF86E04
MVNFEFWMALGTAFVCLAINFLVNASLKQRIKADRRNEGPVTLQRLAGVVNFGGLPVLMIALFLPTTLSEYGLMLSQPRATALWVLILGAVIVPLGISRANSPSNLDMYPQIRNPVWNFRLLAGSAFSWAAYLLAYEFFFRGFLLFACERAVGAIPSIVINVVLYAIAHIHKGRFETIGSIPLGIILCIATLTTGSIWVAFGVHLIMAWSNEWASLAYHKHISFKSGKNTPD